MDNEIQSISYSEQTCGKERCTVLQRYINSIQKYHMYKYTLETKYSSKFSCCRPFCGWYWGWRRWPRCLAAVRTPPSPSAAPTQTRRFLQRGHMTTIYAWSCAVSVPVLLTLTSAQVFAPWTLMSAMLRRSSHTSTWKQPNMATNLKLNIPASLAPLDTAENENHILSHEDHSRHTCNQMVKPHLSGSFPSSPPAFWHLCLCLRWTVTAWRCSGNWWLRVEL